MLRNGVKGKRKGRKGRRKGVGTAIIVLLYGYQLARVRK
jgi:hypothetical protein